MAKKLLALMALIALGCAMACGNAEEAAEPEPAGEPPADTEGDEPAAEPAAEEPTAEADEGGGGACEAYAACCRAMAEGPQGAAWEQACAQIETLQGQPGGEQSCQTAFDAMKQGLAAMPDAPEACT